MITFEKTTINFEKPLRLKQLISRLIKRPSEVIMEAAKNIV